ncbi:MAG: radical SAM protein [Candidatus Bathyarchaeota archaeon]|uniref:radical SAM/SPASM domain-containing protein n=1 Tax=Candidatus Bathycorpusculum sp. TaxID=2994959 RepID=UPI00281F7DEC|nr:radical SAM protein [Candidatus Termiticorpusculum sp.]MCL2257510.1 radical SAM protein [Candidatus Termiticorpusculum sp.]MCL2292352.1 radical SAM protein [Candidatus Termiticorpusculum sp.]
MDQLRYSHTAHQRPVVVWNTTRQCNLQCMHCYSQSENKIYPNELSTEDAKRFIADLADFHVPVLLFSGGEPMMRKDLFELAKFASDFGIRTVMSTNGTLITKEAAKKIKQVGFQYVGVSLDGIGQTNNRFRGSADAFERAVNGIRNCISEGIKAGLRLTVSKYNFADILAIFDFIEAEKIPRACFYHLAYVGRGTDIAKDDLTHKQTRQFMDTLLSKASEFQQKGLGTEILTVDNHADAAYVYMKIKEKDSIRAEQVMQLLKLNGGNSSGRGIGCVDFNGYVHPDQFWQHYSLGNVCEKKFSQIWADSSEHLLNQLRNRKTHLKGKCQTCRFLDICNGNLRVRSEAAYNDVWAPDPACYLTPEEIQQV